MWAQLAATHFRLFLVFSFLYGLKVTMYLMSFRL